MSEAPLAGVRVLDLSRILAEPWATHLLADLGADVVKVERPGLGDDTRGWGPPWFEREDGPREPAYFTCANRGKRSVEINLTTPEGAARVKALAARADVLVENFKVGDLARHGLDHAALHPRLVYCSISGFGQTGSYAARPGYDFVIQAMGGLMSVTGEADGAPMKAGVALVDIMTGLYASTAIFAALNRRERTGSGGYIDLALFDVQLATLANQAANCLATGHAPSRHGNAHPNNLPYQLFRCADGAVAVAVGNDGQFRALCGALGLAEAAADPAYARNSGRVENRTALVLDLQSRFERWPTAAILALLDAAGVPAGPVDDIAAALDSVPAREREMVIRSGPDASPGFPAIACPIRIDGERMIAALGAPSLGEHDAEVLSAPRRGAAPGSAEA